MNQLRTQNVRGVTLRADPAREPEFRIVDDEIELQEWPGMSEASRRERLHRHMHNELTTLEIAAQTLADFPEAPWELRLELARQCWDETRHVEGLWRRLRALGGHKGEFPVSNFEWRVTLMLDSLAARLAVQNRTFEAGEMDFLRKLVDLWRRAGDEETAETLESILCDEIQHVRFANRWLRRLVSEDPRLLLKVAVGLRFLADANRALAPTSDAINSAGTPLADLLTAAPEINVEDRRLAEFTDAEIVEVLRRSGFRDLVARD